MQSVGLGMQSVGLGMPSVRVHVNNGQMHDAQARQDGAAQIRGQILIEAHNRLDQYT